MKDAWLIGCEESGTTVSAFRRHGIKAFSCDTEATRGNPAWHIQGDLLELLRSDPVWKGGIMHEPCTNVANSSAKHLYVDQRKENGPYAPRWDAMVAGATFIASVMDLTEDFPCAHENPIMLSYARMFCPWTPDQTIHPWQFGHREMKATCLCLRGGLPLLKPTDIVGPPPPPGDPERKSWERVFRMPPGPNRQRDRAVTLAGYADAYARQWGLAI